MRVRTFLVVFAATLAVFRSGWVHADLTNTVPWSESFEAYANGTAVAGTNGWVGESSAAGVVTNWLSATNYQAGGGTYPVAGTHSNVLAVNALIANNVAGASGGVVRVDFLALPTWVDSLPAEDATCQGGFCISSNGYLTVWHYNKTAGTNEWRELTPGTVITSNDWHRFTVFNDASNKMFQVAVDEGQPVTNAYGWAQGGAQAGGSWFYMVQTNGVLSQIAVNGAPAYFDDFVAVRRSLAWSGTSFTECVTNNGTVDTALTVTLMADTFAATNGQDLAASGVVTVSDLPSNLTAVVQVQNPTSVVIRLADAAAQHESAYSTNLTIRFLDDAFTLGGAWDVVDNQTNATLTFLDAPVMSYSLTVFHETTTNNGTINNSDACLIGLTNGVFLGTPDEDFAANSAKLVITNLPPDLTGQVLYVSSTQLIFRLLGAATANDVSNDISNLTLIFQDGAFDTVPAAYVTGSSTNFSLVFTDPSVLTYGTTVFGEMAANTGTVNGTTLTLVNRSFDAAEGEDMVLSGKATVTNLPPGLGLQIICDATGTNAVLTFTGSASANVASNSVSNLGVRFGDSAFVGGNAAGVVNYNMTGLQIAFTDPRILTYSRGVFTELCGGYIDNRTPVTITLSGDTLMGSNGEDFRASGKIVSAGLPSGLTAQITRVSPTQLSVQLLGMAAANEPANSVSNATFTFLDGAFTASNAVYVANYTQTVGVTFIADTGFFNVLPYAEPFEDYVDGMWIVGTNGWSGDFANAGVVTNDAMATSNLLAYVAERRRLPLVTNHTQVLYLQDTVKNAIHSETSKTVYVDFMVKPSPVWEAPMTDTSRQSGLFVTTNGQLVIWQQTQGGSAEWITLSNAPAISTSQWARFTIQCDYTYNMFQVQVNQQAPITDPRGWTAGGAAPDGSWFHMVQTNGSLAEIEIHGAGPGHIDDFTVQSSPLDTLSLSGSGSVYLFR